MAFLMHDRAVAGAGAGAGALKPETKKFVYQKQPKSIFPFVNFIFSHEIWSRGGGVTSAVLIHPWGRTSGQGRGYDGSGESWGPDLAGGEDAVPDADMAPQERRSPVVPRVRAPLAALTR